MMMVIDGVSAASSGTEDHRRTHRLSSAASLLPAPSLSVILSKVSLTARNRCCG